MSKNYKITHSITFVITPQPLQLLLPGGLQGGKSDNRTAPIYLTISAHSPPETPPEISQKNDGKKIGARSQSIWLKRSVWVSFWHCHVQSIYSFFCTTPFPIDILFIRWSWLMVTIVYWMSQHLSATSWSGNKTIFPDVHKKRTHHF